MPSASRRDGRAGVVVVQTVEGEAVVEQRRRLPEHLTSHLEIEGFRHPNRAGAAGLPAATTRGPVRDMGSWSLCCSPGGG